jgi:hypothetical protein
MLMDGTPAERGFREKLVPIDTRNRRLGWMSGKRQGPNWMAYRMEEA